MTGLLRNADFRRLFVGRLVTNAGDSIYTIASMWLVFELTGSSLYTGLAGALVLAPQGLQFLFGPLVDRVPTRRLLVGSQLLQGGLVLVIPLAHVLGVLTVWVVLVVMPLLSLLNQPVYPAEAAALPRLVERDQLVSANSLFALAYQGVDAAFNAIAGVLVALVGAMALFVVDSVTFAVAALLFAGLTVRAADESADDGVEGTAVSDGSVATDGAGSYLGDLHEGLGFLRGTVVARVLVGSVVINATLGGTVAVLPAFSDGLGGVVLLGRSLGGEVAFGLLTAAMGVGILAGALGAGLLGGHPVGRLAVVGFAFSAVCWTGALLAGWLPVTAGLLLLAFVPVGVTNVLFASMVQALVPERLLGRVMAVVASASAGATPIGALVGGAVADATTPTTVMWGVVAGFVVLVCYLAAVPSVRRLGPISEVETLTLRG